MWNNEQLKYNAKAELGQSYWLSLVSNLLSGFLSSAVVGLIGSILAMLAFAIVGGQVTTVTNYDGPLNGSIEFFYGGGLWGVFVTLLVAILSIAISGLIMYPFVVGLNRFYVRCPYGDRNINNIFFGFRNGHYKNIFIVMFMQYLFIFLWSLLFVIPGIIKMYEYSMVPYILAENPEMNYKDALALSKAMTQGDKFNIFILELSFIGWFFLGAMACVVGSLFVMPYFNATFAQLYFALKAKVNYQPAPLPEDTFYQQA